MKSTRFNTFTYDIVDEINLGQIEKIAGIDLDYDTNDIHVPTLAEMHDLTEEEVALQLYHPHTGYTKKYACHEPGLTQINISLLLEKADVLPDEICKTAAFFLARSARNCGLPVNEQLAKLAGNDPLSSNVLYLETIDELAYGKKMLAHRQKIANVTKWALPNKKRYALETSEDLEKAASYFDTHYKNFSLKDRLEFAVNTCKEAEHQGMRLSGAISKYAGINTTDFNTAFASHVNMRKQYVLDSEAKEIYDELLEKHASLGVVTSAKALEAIDTHFSLDKLWGRQLEDPITSTCSLVKEAEVEVDGTYISRSQLDRLLEKDLSGWIDPHTKSELASDDGLDVLKSLPEPTREGLLSEI